MWLGRRAGPAQSYKKSYRRHRRKNTLGYITVHVGENSNCPPGLEQKLNEAEIFPRIIICHNKSGPSLSLKTNGFRKYTCFSSVLIFRMFLISSARKSEDLHKHQRYLSAFPHIWNLILLPPVIIKIMQSCCLVI